MDATRPPDVATRRRILRGVVGQAYAIVVALLIASLFVTSSPTPLWVRSVATLTVLGVGGLLAEVFVRVAAQRYPTMQLPAATNVVGAVAASLVGFAVALGVQAALGYSVPITWSTVLEATVSAPIWLIFIGMITAARWRYHSARATLLDERLQIEAIRNVERDALARARISVAESVRPALADLRDQIVSVLNAPHERLMDDTISSLRAGAMGIVRPLSHDLYSRGTPAKSPRRPLRFLVSIMGTQPFRPLLVSGLYLATALPAKVDLYGGMAASAALAIDVLFIIVVLGGANLIMRRVPQAHLWVYVATLVVIHAVPLALLIPGVVDTDPQFTGWATLVEIAASLLLLLGTSSLGLLDANRETMLEQIASELRNEQVAELAEATVLSQAARELGARLHGPVQSTVLASAAALERAVNEEETARAHAVLAEAAAALDAALNNSDGAGGAQSLQVTLTEVIEPWREICPVELVLDDELVNLVGDPAEGVTIVVREAVANAFRHGGSRNVRACVVKEGADLLVIVTDDGAGSGTKNWGLGLTTIDRLSDGHWTLVREGAETVLTVRIPIGLPVDSERQDHSDGAWPPVLPAST